MDRIARLAVTDPEWGRRHLPRLLDALFADGSTARLDAAWAVCRLVDALPSALPAVRRGLGDRLDDRGVERGALREAAVDGDCPLAVLLVVHYLDARGQRVARVARAARAEADGPGRAGARTPERGGGGGEGGPAVGGPGVLGGEVNDGDRDTDGEDGSDADDAAGTGSGTDGVDAGTTRRPRWPADADDTLDAVVAASRFDEVVRRGPGIDTGYGREFLLVVADGETERTVAMTLLDCPTDDDGFLDAVDEGLAAWQRVDDHEGVATVVDRGHRPRPWFATEYVAETLASRAGPTGTAAALRDARAVAAAVAHAHDRGVVHGGLAPRTVVYRDDALDGRAAPRVTDVGLARALRRHVPPSRYLDRRFAAPEYFDRSHGAVDAATDVYHLGTICYRLVTGRPPYEGDPETVRAGVLGGTPTPPSDVVDGVDPAVDDVVARAMATRKLVRYDSVRELLGDLEALAE